MEESQTRMVSLDVKKLTEPLGIVRILEIVFTCVTFSLVASVGYSLDPFWTWCMFSWCFCFCVTILILILEITAFAPKLPISWGDFTSTYSILATMMVFVASLIYSIFFIYSNSGIAACVFSYLTFGLYSGEVGMTRAKPGEVRGFLSTVPGLFKVLETFVACTIFICLPYTYFWVFPGLQWCVAVYSICFSFSFLVIVFTIYRLSTSFPAPFQKVLTVCNVVAVLLYFTAVIIWPVFCLTNNPRPPNCSGVLCGWNFLVVVSVMTSFNLVVYIVDAVYSYKFVFVTTET